MLEAILSVARTNLKQKKEGFSLNVQPLKWHKVLEGNKYIVGKEEVKGD
jgi:hypothetical protein